MQPTDLRVVKTLKQIDQALLTCLAEAPFEKVTVEQLCRAALINRSTFYKYYTSKYDLMEQYLQRALDGFRRQVDVAFVNATPETNHNLLYQKKFREHPQIPSQAQGGIHPAVVHSPGGKRLWPDGGPGARRHSGNAARRQGRPRQPHRRIITGNSKRSVYHENCSYL